jgi:chitodextrinase
MTIRHSRLQNIKTAQTALVLVTLFGASVAWAFPPPPRDRTPPTRPTNLHVTGVSDFHVSLAWTGSTDNSGSFFYVIVSSSGQIANAGMTNPTCTFTTGHNAGATYTFYVYARDQAGNTSQNSNTVSATLLPAGSMPSAPTLTLTHVGPQHIALAWTPASDNGPPIRYWFYWNGQLLFPGGQTTSHTLYYLQPQTTHTITVQARDGINRFSPHSNAITVTTPAPDPNDTTPPTTPANLWAGSIDGATEFELVWGASTDAVTPQAYIRYDIYLNGVLLDWTVGRTRVTEYGESGQNILEVTATDEAGNTSAPATTTIQIP